MRLLKILLPLLILSHPAMAEPPNVVTDIPPVHSLVSAVMENISEPSLLIAPGTSPHHNALRPSQMRDMNTADLIIWIGEGLTPWLHDSLDVLPEDASVLTLGEAGGITQLPFRDTLKDDDHDHDHDHDHGHGVADPHLWLDPENAQTWLTLIADVLSEQDPDNATLYQENAARLQTELQAISTETTAAFSGITGSYLAGHDSYQYFEHRFGLTFAGAISLGDASKPGPARIQAIREEAAHHSATCLAIDLGTSPDLVATVVEGTGLTATIIDPLGATLKLGPTLYPTLITGLTKAFKTCLEPVS